MSPTLIIWHRHVLSSRQTQSFIYLLNVRANGPGAPSDFEIPPATTLGSVRVRVLAHRMNFVSARRCPRRSRSCSWLASRVTQQSDARTNSESLLDPWRWLRKKSMITRLSVWRSVMFSFTNILQWSQVDTMKTQKNTVTNFDNFPLWWHAYAIDHVQSQNFPSVTNSHKRQLHELNINQTRRTGGLRERYLKIYHGGNKKT